MRHACLFQLLLPFRGTYHLHVVVPLITSGCRCGLWYSSRLSVCLARIGWCCIVNWERKSEREREHLCRSPCLLSCAQCSGPAAPSFLPHFLPTAGCLLSRMLVVPSPFALPPSRTKYFGGVEWLTTCFAWSEFREIRTSERRGVKREKRRLSILPEGIYFTVSRRNVIPESSFRSSHTSHLCKCLEFFLFVARAWQRAGNMAACCIVCVCVCVEVCARCLGFFFFFCFFVSVYSEAWCGSRARVCVCFAFGMMR